MIPYSPIKVLEFCFLNQSRGAIYTVVVFGYKKQLTRPRVLAAAMDLFRFYRGRLLLEKYAFCDLKVRKTSFFVLKVSFSIFKLFRRGFEAILVSVR